LKSPYKHLNRGVIFMPKVIKNVREKILIEGKSLLLKNSYSGFNIREISKNCSIGLGTFYNYFKNKDDLAIEIFKDDWQYTLSLIDTLKTSNHSFKDKLFEIYSSLEGFVGRYMSIFHEIAAVKGSGNHCPDYNSDLYLKVAELIDKERIATPIRNDIPSDKLSIFIVSNMFSSIRNRNLNFDEIYLLMDL